MTRFADPSRCPDCEAPLTPGATACTRCLLSLQGPTAQRLFATLSHADSLLAELRAASVPAAAPAAAPAAGAGSPVAPAPDAWTPPPAPAAAPTPAPSRGMSAVSVPRILLTLGAGCLLVAALVFLAVAWSVLGVGGRTAVLVGFTAIAGSLSFWMARRGLRAATESLALVGYGLLTLDVIGADNAGWFGDLSTAGLLALLGVLLAATGVVGALAAGLTKVSGLVSGEVVGALGVGLVVLAIDLSEWLPVSVSLVAGVLVAAAAAVALLRPRLLVAAIATAVIATVAWLAQLVYALDRVDEHSATWQALWAGGHALPLLVSAALVAAPVLVRRLPVAVRVAAAAVGQTLVVYAALAPAVHLAPTAVALVGLGVLVAASAATWVLPRPWGLANVLTQGLAGAAVLVLGAVLFVMSLGRLAEVIDPVWAGGVGDLLPDNLSSDVPAPWVLPLCLLAVLAAGWSVARASSTNSGALTANADLRVMVASLLAMSLTATAALYPVPVWVPVAMLLLTGAGLTAWWIGSRRPAPLGLAVGFTTAGVVVSLHADWLSAIALVAMLVLAVLIHLRSLRSDVAGLAGALLVVTLAGSAWTWGSILDADAEWLALAGLLVIGAVALVAPYAPARWWRCDDPAEARFGIEAGAAAAALPLLFAGVALAPAGAQSEWTAVYLTTAGVVVTLMSLLRADRRELGWAGGLLLAMASWVRLWDLGVSAPEAYTLPSAAALLVVGVVHLRRNPEASTMTALGPGLSLALVPSLLWALNDPTDLRSLLLGLGCLILVLAGAGLRWTAPIALGATVGALLVIRLAAPYVADAVPRWVLLGTAGALLVALGATWERRLGEARQVVGYVRALR